MMRWAGPGIAAIVLLAACLGGAASPERLILTGTPPSGPTWLSAGDGALIPAGCGPEAARILLSYYDRRYGYRFVTDPGEAIVELRRWMGTITVFWGGVHQGLTWPWAFSSGLRAYAAARYPAGLRIETAGGSLATVFDRSVALLARGIPHVILFNWRGEGGIFPNHYAVVVGYDRSGGRQHLVVNPGWGYDFQLLDMGDPAVAPVRLYWIEEVRDPPGAEPGVSIGPPAAAGMWERDEKGDIQLRPVLRLHHDPGSTVRWPRSSSVEFLLAGDDGLAIATWSGR